MGTGTKKFIDKKVEMSKGRGKRRYQREERKIG